MPMSWGRALSAIGGGLTDWAGELTQRRERQQSVDSQLASRGYFRREPKTDLASGSGMMESVASQSDPMLDAVAQGGYGMTLVPGMRPRPLSASLGMGVEEAEEPGVVRAEALGHFGAEPPSVRPGPEQLMALKSAVRGAPPKNYSDAMEFEGGTYEYDPERTPEGRRAGLRAALQRQQQQAAYASWLRNNPGHDVAFDAVDDWQAVNREGLRADTRAAEPPTINVGGRRFPDTPQGQAQAIAWDRALNPPRETGGGGGGSSGGSRVERDANGLTPPTRDERTQNAQAELETLAMSNWDAYSSGSRSALVTEEELRGIMRRYPGASLPQVVRHGQSVFSRLSGER